MERRTAPKWTSWVALALWLGGCNTSHEGGIDTSASGAAASGKSAKQASAASDSKQKKQKGDASDAGDGIVCTDDDAGVAEGVVLEPHTLALWPPNHKFHEISIADCVTVIGDCDDDLHAEFIWASSDEPVDDKGDGHHAPDIALGEDCRRVAVRSERQGPENGRVYKLGVRVVDGAGVATEAACTIIVDHDQRGVVGADSGEKYRVTFANAANGDVCDGRMDDPPNPPNPPNDPPNPPNPPNDPPNPPDPPEENDGPGPS